MSSEKRQIQISNGEKVKAVKWHLIDKKPVSEIAENLGISPKTYYKWQQTFFLNGELAFNENKNKKQEQEYTTKVTELNKEINKKNEIISELVTDNYNLKKKSIGLQ